MLFFRLLGSGGFEPSKAEPTDLQSAPFDRSGNSPKYYQKQSGKKNGVFVLFRLTLLLKGVIFSQILHSPFYFVQLFLR